MNNLRKKINGIIIYVILLAFITSCTDFLTKTDPSNFTSESFYNSGDQARSGVNAIYSSLFPVHGLYNGGAYDGLPWMMTEFTTGHANYGSPQALDIQRIRSLNMAARNSFTSVWWVSSYRGIANANEAIENIPDIEMDDGEKKSLLGEARFLRAYHYFNLVRLYGKVPLITKPVNLNSDKIEPSRDSIEDVYSLIVEDLTKAEESGLPYTDSSGKVSLGAVKSLLATVYLTMAGYPLDKDKEYYQLASDKAKEIIESNSYQLFSSYDDLHDPSKDNTGENIFMVQYNKTPQPSNRMQSAIIPYQKAISKYSEEAGAIHANRSFVESYEAGDKRAEEKESFYTEFTSESDRSQTVDLGGYYLWKWFDKDANVNTAKSELNWQILRYAEILLTYAEAENEVSGPTPEAYEAVNKIRRRANISDLSGLSKSEFRRSIWKERWHELCFENKTWFDMARLRKGFNVSNGTFDDFVGHSFSYGPTLTEKELLFPIPADELNDNENLTQNPGY